ncbi:polynucleotide adenylyltransferase PcnB [Geobacter sp. SVR]|uniref:polynucleotide adenylyltransferase PcnB n=1 Tax=Geobacter sp. SVR TaxID=2495594 RepID=UPI00143F009D|nr:polynucleotide adenylyltransferase PcnB [Geobacter sp. SVR]BCS55303.1 poly(A) polymerase I [Geobacter sp. SVR]GCF86102.1 poly(A) polymerase I [Geobacter sp. SVR]
MKKSGSIRSKREEGSSVIIARQDHGISRKLMSPNALRVLYRLKDNGFVGYLVGGCVRDLLLGREPKDFDVVTNATPGEIKRIFRNCRLIGRRFRLAHIHFLDEIIEVATFRSQASNEPEPEPEEGNGTEQRQRHPRMLKDEEGMILRDNVYGTPEEDALRRDFTVNALSYNIADFSIIDYVGGLADLNAGIIRIIGDPVVRFQEDPVRMLRAVRFAAQLGFTIEEGTLKALVAAADTIVRAAPPRLYDEMLKLLLSGEGDKCYDLLRHTGLFAALFPHFSAWLDAESEGFPHTRFGEMLAYVDSRIQQGDKISQPLLLALLFGEYLDEKAENFRRQGAPWQQSVYAALGEFMGEVCPIVLITNRVGFALRDIIAQQTRLKKVPGRRPEAFIARHDFNDIIAYCRITRGDQKEVARQLDWWEARAQQQEPLPPPADSSEETEAPQRKRRRRRRRRPKADKKLG